MAAAAPWDFADNGRREKPTTPSWYSCVIDPGSNFQIADPSPCRPTRRAEIPSRERETITLCQIQSNDTSRIQPDRCIMAESELHDVFSSAQRPVKSMKPRALSSYLDIVTIQRYDNAQNDLKCRPHARRGAFSFPHCKILSK